MSGNPLAGTARVGWMELRSHLKSPRLLVLVALFALLVFAVSYGASQSPSSGFSNQPVLSLHPAIRNESGADHYLVIGWYADLRGVPRSGVTVSLYRGVLGGPTGGMNETFLTSQDTNATGFVVFDLGTSVNESIAYMARTTGEFQGLTMFTPNLQNVTFTANVGTQSSYGPMGGESTTTVHVMSIDGFPATGAEVLLDGSLAGHPDANGFFSGSLAEGQHTLNVTYKGYTESYFVFGSGSGGPVFENGADYVLAMMSQTFLPLILPIVGIAVSFDAVTRERAQGTLEILLARRVQRDGVFLGKFLGTFAAAALPVTAVLLVGVGILAAASGKTPSAVLVVTVILMSLFLVAVYILFMLLFSTLAKSVGTAVVLGVVLWLFYALFFSFITLFMMVASGGSLFSPETYGALITVQLFDPNMIFQMLVSLATPSSGGPIGLVPTGYLSTTAILVAAVLWVVVLLVLALLVFRKRAES